MKLTKLTATWLDGEVLKRFKLLVIAKHGTFRVHLGEALADVMRVWIKGECYGC